MNKYKSMRISAETYKLIKLEAVKRGVSLIALIEKAVKREIKKQSSISHPKSETKRIL